MKISKKKLAAGAVLPAIAIGAFAGISLSASPAHANNTAGVTHHAVASTVHHLPAAAHHQAAGKARHTPASATRHTTAAKVTHPAVKRTTDVPARRSGAGEEHASTATRQAPVTAPAMSSAESSFEKCVAWRESTDTPTDPDGLFGILPSTWQQLGYSGSAGQASVAVQKIAFNRLYEEYGTQPWAPSDGC